jgi:thiamine-monophosphate kinase
MKNNDRQTLSESFIINNYFKKLNFKKKESFNFENDGAYLNISQNKKIVVSNDTIVEGVDFFTNEDADSIAHKIICYNLSDISSMGAAPYCFNLSLGLPKKISKKWLRSFSSKILKLQKKYKFFLLGGDIAQTKHIVVSATFFGRTISGKIIRRDGAKINDDIWVTGNLGNSFAGLMFKKNIIKANDTIKKFFIKKYLYPDPCMVGDKLRLIATSAIDISDGFYGDLNKLLQPNNLGANIDVKSIPILPKLKNLILSHKFKINKLLSAGDDYEILFTSGAKKRNFINALSKKNKINITKVGTIIDKKNIHIDGKILNLNKRSFQYHF